MNWQVLVRPEAEDDVSEAADWYEGRSAGLGNRFIEEIIAVFDDLSDNPLISCRCHPKKNIRWRYPEHFPFRVIYEVIEHDRTVIVAAVLHAARHDRHWRDRL